MTDPRLQYPPFDPAAASSGAQQSLSGDSAGPNPVDEMGEYLIRSEEQLRISKDPVVVGRARLEKYVVTETKTITVQLSREEVRLVREVVGDGPTIGLAEDVVRQPAPGHDTATEQAPWLELTEERLVVTKEVVPVERVRLQHTVLTEQRVITEDLRQERVTYADDRYTPTDPPPTPIYGSAS